MRRRFEELTTEQLCEERTFYTRRTYAVATSPALRDAARLYIEEINRIIAHRLKK